MSTTPANTDYTKEEAEQEVAAAAEIVEELGEVVARLDHVLLRLHNRNAHTVLGYKSWRKFVDERFPSIKVNRSYQLMRHASKVTAIEELTGYDSGLNEGQTRGVPAEMVPDLAKLALEKIKGGTEPLLAHKEATEETVARAQKAKEQRDPDTSSASNAARDDAPSADKHAEPESSELPASTSEEPERAETETPEDEESSEEAAALHEASESLASEIQSIDKPVPYNAPRVFDAEQVDEAWIAEAAEFLRGCPNRATFDALKVEIEQTYEIIEADLALQMRKTA